MNKRIIQLSLCVFCGAVLLLSGCRGSSADGYVGETITGLKDGDPASFSPLLEAGLDDAAGQFVLSCPEEIKEPYLEFLQTAFSAIQFRVAAATERSDDTWSVSVTYRPVDLEKTVGAANDTAAREPLSSDFAETMLSVLETDSALAQDAPISGSETTTELEVSLTEDGFSIAPEDLQAFLESALPGYMAPYLTFLELYDMRDFLTSYLDASFKGEVARFALHTGRTEDEALDWYQSETFDPPEDLSEAYIPRYQAALQNIMRQCIYTVGVPRKNDGLFNYEADVTVTPNNSLADAFREFEQGTYYSMEEVSAGLVAALEKYASAPSYGAETTVTVPINAESLANADQEGSELTSLAVTILPLP